LSDESKQAARSGAKPAEPDSIRKPALSIFQRGNPPAVPGQPQTDWGQRLVDNLNRNVLANVPAN
jgi:hypothetical protein